MDPGNSKRMKLEILAAQVEALETVQAVTFPIGGKIKPNILRCYSLLHLSNSKLLHIHPILANSIYSSSKVLETQKKNQHILLPSHSSNFPRGLTRKLAGPKAGASINSRILSADALSPCFSSSSVVGWFPPSLFQS